MILTIRKIGQIKHFNILLYVLAGKSSFAHQGVLPGFPGAFRPRWPAPSPLSSCTSWQGFQIVAVVFLHDALIAGDPLKTVALRYVDCLGSVHVDQLQIVLKADEVGHLPLDGERSSGWISHSSIGITPALLRSLDVALQNLDQLVAVLVTDPREGSFGKASMPSSFLMMAHSLSPSRALLGLASCSRYMSAQTLRRCPSLVWPGAVLRSGFPLLRGGGVPCRPPTRR